MSDSNPSALSLQAEIHQREEELTALRVAFGILQKNTNNGGAAAVTPGPPASTLEPPPPGKRKTPTAVSRASTKRLLGFFDRRRARSLEQVATRAKVSPRHIAVGVLLKHAYLKRKGEGFVRTSKEFVL